MPLRALQSSNCKFAVINLKFAIPVFRSEFLQETALNVRAIAVLSLCSLVLAAGCGPDLSHLPKTVPASGVLTLDGKPVEGAQVVIVPANSEATGAYATTDASGKFSLRAFNEKDGAIPGEYKVQVTKTVEVKLAGPKGSLDGGDPVRFDYGVPAKYTGVKTSGLSVTIPETGINDIKLALTSK
jgi:hypothetical protein